MKSFRINKNPKRILIRAFEGAASGRCIELFNAAVRRATEVLNGRGIEVMFESFSSDEVKNGNSWSPTDLVDALLEADIHLLYTHLHEGNIGKTIEWNINNILGNLDRLEFHLGNFMGARTKCHIFRQGKIEIYKLMPDYCLPSVAVTLPALDWTDDGKCDFISSEDMEALEK